MVAAATTNNTYVRDPFVDLGDALNVLKAPLDLSGVFETGQIVMSSQFLFLPILLLVMGLAVFLSLLLAFVFQWLCCCECKQKVFPTQQVEMLKDVLHNYQNCCSASFYTLCIYMILVVQLIMYRRTDALAGVRAAQDFSAFLQMQHGAMTTSAAALTAAAATLVDDVQVESRALTIFPTLTPTLTLTPNLPYPSLIPPINEDPTPNPNPHPIGLL